MYTKTLILSAALATAACPSTLLAGETLSGLEATSPWNIDYAPENCRLSRRFGEDDDVVTMHIIKTNPDRFFDLSFVSNAFGKPDDAFGLKLRFGGLEEREFDRGVFVAKTSDGQSALLAGRNTFSEWDTTKKEWIDPEDAELATIRRIEIELPKKRAISLLSGPMDAPMLALENCYDDLVRTWGFEPDALEQLSEAPEPIGSPAKWLTEYPLDLLRNRQTARLELRLAIGSNGTIEDCVVQNLVGNEAFAETTCEHFKRKGRFKPARDADGNAVRGLWFDTIVFGIGPARRINL